MKKNVNRIIFFSIAILFIMAYFTYALLQNRSKATINYVKSLENINEQTNVGTVENEHGALSKVNINYQSVSENIPETEYQAEPVSENDSSESVSAAAVTSAAAMSIIEVSTGRVLAQKNAFSRRPMASTTKIMTAIVVLENAGLKDKVKVDPKAVGVEGSSIYLQKDEVLTVEDLLYGLMLQSGNDASVALAIHTAGSVEKFSEMMNKKAKEIGAENTNFTNPNGLHNDNHYTTAYDLGIISAYGMRNPEFKKIVGTKSYKATWEGRDYPRIIKNKNKLLSSYEGATGIKTGFTKKAGRCLVSSSMKDGMEVVCVVLNCGPMFEDCARLMTEAHNKFKLEEIIPEYFHIGEVPVVNAKTQSLKVYTKNKYMYPLTENEKSKIYSQTDLPSVIDTPIKKDSEIGVLKIFYEDQLLRTEKIYALEDVQPFTYRDRLKKVVENFFR